jgi:hypothetical protein
MPKYEQLSAALERWNKMAEKWNEGMSKNERLVRHSKVEMFIKSANMAHYYMNAATKLCQKT